MAILDLTSGGRATYVLGPAHPALLAAREAATPAAAAGLRAALEEATGLTLLSWHPTGEAARERAVAVARAATGRAMVVACRGARIEPGARLVAHGDGLQTAKALEGEGAAAFVLEVVQVTGGVRVPPPGYLERVRQTCTDLGTLLVADETAGGFGRTGSLLSIEKEEVTADLVAVSLALMPGVDGGALLGRPELAAGLDPGEPPPEAAAVALAAIETLRRDDLIGRVRKLGKLLQKGVTELVETRRRWAMDSRGRGLVRTLVLWDTPAIVLAACAERGLAIGPAGDAALLLAPPLVASPDDITETLGLLSSVLAVAA